MSGVNPLVAGVGVSTGPWGRRCGVENNWCLHVHISIPAAVLAASVYTASNYSRSQPILSPTCALEGTQETNAIQRNLDLVPLLCF